MKKILVLITLMISMVMNIQAQNWEIQTIDADELKGNDTYTAYIYSDPNVGSFIFWSNKDSQYRIINNNGIFNYTSGYNKYTGSYRGLDITIGLYDDNNKLIEKINMWLDAPDDKPTFLETRDMGSMFNPVGQKKKVKKILNHLKTSNGYVRIIAETYGNHSNFDLKIPCGKL